MNIIYFSHNIKSNNRERVKFSLDTFINKVANKQIEFNLEKKKIIKSTFINESYLKLIFFILRFLIGLPINIILEIYLIFVSNKRYYKITRDSIIDRLERQTGELTTRKNKKRYIFKNLLKFKIYAFKISLFTCFIKLLVKNPKKLRLIQKKILVNLFI